MKLVILESPFAGDVERNKRYLQRAIRDCLARGESPYASHQMLTDALDDTIPGDRELGIVAGLAWRKVAERTVVYEDHGRSRGMVLGIEHALANGGIVEFRSIGAEPAFVADSHEFDGYEHDCARCGEGRQYLPAHGSRRRRRMNPSDIIVAEATGNVSEADAAKLRANPIAWYDALVDTKRDIETQLVRRKAELDELRAAFVNRALEPGRYADEHARHNEWRSRALGVVRNLERRIQEAKRLRSKQRCDVDALRKALWEIVKLADATALGSTEELISKLVGCHNIASKALAGGPTE